MMDWDGQEFSIKGKSMPVLHADVRGALKPTRELFTDKQVFIRDRMDAFLGHLELLQQGIEAKIFTVDDVAFPIDYYIDQINSNIGMDIFKKYIVAFNFPRSATIVDSILKRRAEVRAKDGISK
jgi:hypothetical protein